MHNICPIYPFLLNYFVLPTLFFVHFLLCLLFSLSTLYSIRFVLCPSLLVLPFTRYSVYPILCLFFTIVCPLFTIVCSLFTLFTFLYCLILLCPLFTLSTLYTVHFLLCPLFTRSTLYTLHFVYFLLCSHFTLSIFHPVHFLISLRTLPTPTMPFLLCPIYSTYSYSAYLSSVYFYFAHSNSVSTFTRLTHSSAYLSLCSFVPVHFFYAYSGPTFTLCPALTLCSLLFCSHSYFALLSLLTLFVYSFLTTLI